MDVQNIQFFQGIVDVLVGCCFFGIWGQIVQRGKGRKPDPGTFLADGGCNARQGITIAKKESA